MSTGRSDVSEGVKFVTILTNKGLPHRAVAAEVRDGWTVKSTTWGKDKATNQIKCVLTMEHRPWEMSKDWRDERAAVSVGRSQMQLAMVLSVFLVCTTGLLTAMIVAWGPG